MDVSKLFSQGNKFTNVIKIYATTDVNLDNPKIVMHGLTYKTCNLFSDICRGVVRELLRSVFGARSRPSTRPGLDGSRPNSVSVAWSHALGHSLVFFSITQVAYSVTR